jgi:hypothetical protein
MVVTASVLLLDFPMIDNAPVHGRTARCERTGATWLFTMVGAFAGLERLC